MSLTIRQEQPLRLLTTPTRPVPPVDLDTIADIAESLQRLPIVAVRIVAPTELDDCSECPEALPLCASQLIVAHRSCDSRFVYRDPTCCCCVSVAVRAHLRNGAAVWVEIPATVPA